MLAFHGGEDRVRKRIVDALAGSVRLDKTALRAKVAGSQTAFLRALKTLIESSLVAHEGRGRRGHPRLYYLTGR